MGNQEEKIVKCAKCGKKIFFFSQKHRMISDVIYCKSCYNDYQEKQKKEEQKNLEKK